MVPRDCSCLSRHLFVAIILAGTTGKIHLVGLSCLYLSSDHFSNQENREMTTSTATRRLDCSDVDLSHLHHRIERALGGSGIGIRDRFRQSQRRNLPGQAPFVLAPTARTLFAAVADDFVPVMIGFG